jgi:acyl-CoA reductase-like NAD-dependent aldehyde dehydrogenase
MQTTISPHNQQPYITRQYPDEQQLDAVIDAAAAAQKTWRAVPLEKRIEIGRRFMDEFKTPLSDRLPVELAMQMGRPIAQCAGEARGMLGRAQYMLDIAASALADVSFANSGNSEDSFLKASADAPGFKRYIRREPLGVVLVVAPWNFPYLTAINSVLPALIAGNTVLLKPSPQTPLTAELLAQAWHAAVNALIPGFEDTLQVTHLPPPLVARAARSRKVDFVSFTGSVPGGKSVAAAAASYEGGEAEGFKGVGLELGGKDPAYVRADADLAYTAAELVDGAFFNSGQSCCSVERIYVHESVYDEFVERVKAVVESYVLGDPTDPKTNLGPVVSLASAERIRKQITDALAAGAKSTVPESLFPIAKVGTTYVAPTVLVDVDHSMDVMMVCP